MNKYSLTQDAKADLIAIRHFSISNWGKSQSNKYLTELDHTFQMLACSPKLGKNRPEISPDVFSFPYGSHVIYYKLLDNQVIIFALLHKHMVPSNHLPNRPLN